MPDTKPVMTGFCATCGYPIEMTIISANNIRPENDRAWLHTTKRNPETPPHAAMYVRGKSELAWSASYSDQFKVDSQIKKSSCTLCGKPIVFAPVSTAGSEEKAWFHDPISYGTGHPAIPPKPTLGEALNDATDLPTSSDRDGIWFIDPAVRNRAIELEKEQKERNQWKVRQQEQEAELRKRMREQEAEERRIKRQASNITRRSHLTIRDYTENLGHPKATISVSAEELVKKSFDHQAEGDPDGAQLDMLRAIYTQQAEMDMVYWARWDEDGEKTDVE